MIDQRASAAGPTKPSGPEFRATFHHELRDLELDLQDMAVLARNGLRRAVRALVADDQALSAAVIAGDDEIDRRYLDIERRVLGLLARQAPVAVRERPGAGGPSGPTGLDTASIRCRRNGREATDEGL
jgi:PhoU domain